MSGAEEVLFDKKQFTFDEALLRVEAKSFLCNPKPSLPYFMFSLFKQENMKVKTL